MENISNNKCEFISVVEGFRNYIFNEKPYFTVLEHSGAIMTFCNQNFVEKASKMLAYLSQLMVNENPLLLYDDTVFCSCKNGFLITDKRVLITDRNPVLLKDIQEIRMLDGYVYFYMLNSYFTYKATLVKKETVESFVYALNLIVNMSKKQFADEIQQDKLRNNVNESLVNWFCPMCGYKNDGRFCPKCGTPKPII